MAHLMSLRADAAAQLGQLLQDFQLDAPRDSLLSQLDTLTLDFHLIAAATLLVDGNPQGFFLNLCRAAENWRRLLLLLDSRKLAPPPATRTVPLLAALAAGHFPLAEALARPPAAGRLEGEEYEDEYLWALLLRHLALSSPASTVKPRVAQLLKVNARQYGARCELALALLSQDAQAFTEAFEKARLDYELLTEKKAASFSTPVTAFAPHRYLWLEGLALLRLAERAGFALEAADWKFCPPLARVPMTAQYTGDWTIPLREPSRR